ncbi:cobalamin B12-binding domain-containing protein [Rhodobacter lacus]|uniref:B12-binding domain-containing protein n=1 Tax=Rhodobacter lacus TaxID=1641972 RepID=A0ABW5A631_9RHOB
MRDISFEVERANGSLDGFVGLALEAIGRLAARRRDGVGELRTALVNRLVELATGPELGAMDLCLDDFRGAFVASEDIASKYVPAAARQIGLAWEADQLSFAQVTVGIARLQELLHSLQSDFTADSSNPANTSTVLVIVPPGEQHTLGALVVAMGLRRKGISVRLLFAPGLSDLSRLMSTNRFDAALITVGSMERVEISAKLVKTLSSLTKGRMRVAIGGAIVAQRAEALAKTGADLVTNDLSVVISEFALA